MAQIDHEIKIDAPIETVKQALTTISGLRSWHTSAMDGDIKLNGILISKAKDKPAFHWKIMSLEPTVIWECIEGPGDSVGTQAIFNFSETKDGRVLVELSHTEWPHQHGNYRKCNTLWAILLHHLKNYAETGVVEPAFN